jgi:apolipoprotein N-acyltransferase
MPGRAGNARALARRVAPMLLGVLASALLLPVYAQGGYGWPLGFVALVPWLIALDASSSSLARALLGAWAMSIGFVVAAFAWFGSAIDAYLGIGVVPAVALLCVCAPLLQPQLFAFALVRHAIGVQRAWTLRAGAGAAAWVACEALVPKLFGDTLGHGLHPSAWLRQGADLGGAAGLSVILLLVNEALARAWTQRGDRRAAPRAALFALALPLLLAGYGAWRLQALERALAEPAPTLRIAMVQANLTDYERRRREQGAHAVVRDVLDSHFALSRAAIEHHGAEALLWSETVYPTTFGQAQSEAGAELDREIVDFAAANQVPLLFGSFEREAGAEYNAAVVLAPDGGVVGRYRKTHPFPMTEHVPRWLEHDAVRRAVPWLGGWQPGDGARVLPLRTRDGRTLDVVPLICRDDVVPGLAIDGARLGAKAIVGLSNDSWFTHAPQGARLHLRVAAFRSIETRLPQLRVTTNGLSAFVDPTGAVLASTAMGDRAVLAGEVPLRDPPSTLMLRWGDWIGRAATVFLIGLALAGGARAWRRHARRAGPAAGEVVAPGLPGHVVLFTPLRRTLVAALRIGAGLGLAWLALRMALYDGWQVQSMLQLRLFGFAVVLPLILAWVSRGAWRASVRIDADALLLQSRSLRIEIPLASLATLRPWALSMPGPGVDLVLRSGRRLGFSIGIDDPLALLHAFARAGADVRWDSPASEGRARDVGARARAGWPRLDHALVKFGLFPLLMSLPAFRLHQHIAFGATFGEAYTFGVGAWLTGLLIWWGAWAAGLMLFAALLRMLVEIAMQLAARVPGVDVFAARAWLDGAGRSIYYLGLPAWMMVRLVFG